MLDLQKLYTLTNLEKKLSQSQKKIVFTNGCFDIVHAGHVDYLSKAKKLGDILIIGVNSDTSIRSIKGPKRPIVSLEYRLKVLDSLSFVDYLVVFEEDTPLNLIKTLKPSVLVKGADWEDKKVVGQDVVESYGGTVKLLELVPSISTTEIINKIIKLHT